MKLDFNLDKFGNRFLSGSTFENRQFSDLVIDPPVGKKICLENCKFINCSTSPGTCVIGSYVSLDRVVICSLDCGDAILISSNADLNEVVISGECPKALIVRPEDECGIIVSEPKRTTFQLDISGFQGNVSIVGLRGNMIRKDSNRHVVVQGKWKSEVNWHDLGIGPFSYWRIFVKKLSVFNAEEGVFSLPDPSDKDYAETMMERELMEKSGVKFF